MSDELEYFKALRKIAREYLTVDELRRKAEKQYGLPFEEALEMAYENLQSEAERVIYGKRAPKS